MSKNVTRIPSKLYYDLYEKGGDKLVAAFCILKNARANGESFKSYTAKNNKKVAGYSLLRKRTVLSLHSLKKYVPLLMELEVCHFTESGDFKIIGNNKSKNKYNKKLVPITIGKNFVDTQYNSYSVRLHSSYKVQKIMIQRKRHRSELILQLDDPKSSKLYKKAKRYVKKYGKDIQLTDTVILSNQGFSELKGKSGTKSSGCYYKSQLRKKGLIKSKRRFKLLRKMSYEEYRKFKINSCYFPFTYIRGCMASELPASLIPLESKQSCESPSKPNKANKPIEMGFDFLAWLQNTEHLQ